MILETVTGTNGLIPPPMGYLKGVRNLLTKYGILMICDEVMCGLGRTGEWFASKTMNLKPDLMATAKGLTSGYQPMSAVLVGERVAEKLISDWSIQPKNSALDKCATRA